MDELGKSFPAAEGLVDAEENAKGSHPNEFCLNCETKLEGVFCHHCGQKDIPQRQTLGELLQNFISSFWSYEGKFFQTTKYLLIRPGFLATEYTAGRRERYYHPARMYVFISFVFFLLLVSLPDTDNDSNDNEDGKVSKSGSPLKNLNMPIPLDRGDYKELRNDLNDTGLSGDSIMRSLGRWNADSTEFMLSLGKIDSLKRFAKENDKKRKRGKSDDDGWDFSLSGTKYKSKQEYDSIQNALPEDKRDGWLERSLEERNIELAEKYKGDNKQFGKDFMQVFTDNFSKVLFWLLPIFALLLKLLYVRRDFYYSEHLVFTIYYYNFFFLAGSLQMIANQFAWLEWLGTVIGFWIFFYLLFAMKRMYLQGWGKTILKFLSFNFLFFICFSIALAISAMAALLVI